MAHNIIHTIFMIHIHAILMGIKYIIMILHRARSWHPLNMLSNGRTTLKRPPFEQNNEKKENISMTKNVGRTIQACGICIAILVLCLYCIEMGYRYITYRKVLETPVGWSGRTEWARETHPFFGFRAMLLICITTSVYVHMKVFQE